MENKPKNTKENREQATKLILNWVKLKYYSKTELADILGIKRPTLYSRIENSDWRAKELEIIWELN
jgi:DNA invertase Pin-like site-specific DNA recombinase